LPGIFVAAAGSLSFGLYAALRLRFFFAGCGDEQRCALRQLLLLGG